MSDLIFPALPGVAITCKRAPEWESTVHKSASGLTAALSAMTHPNWRYGLSFEVLRSGDQAELQSIVALFNQVHGRADTWLFLDDEDNTAANQTFAQGDGVTRTFRLARSYGGVVEPIYGLAAAPTTISAAGVAQSPLTYTWASNGKVTFNTAPSNGAALAWSGVYYMRCRFDDDVMDAERFLYRLWNLKKLNFTTVKVK